MSKPSKVRHPVVERDGRLFKTCMGCTTEQELEAFYVHEGKPLPRCKRCHHKAHGARYHDKTRGQMIWGGRYDKEDLKTKTKLEIDIERGWKHCTGCNEQHPLEEYEFDKRWSVYGTRCLGCQAAKTLSYRNRNRDAVRANSRRYGKEIRSRPEIMKRISAEKRRYHRRNALSVRVGIGMRESLGSEGKRGKTWRSLVPYTLDELRAHIESQFTTGMTWDAFKDGFIEIDHVLPKALFTFETSDDPQFAACWALSNLQPLWGRDNVIKSDLLDDGRRARDMSPDEKRAYLTAKGFGHLFPAASLDTDQARLDPAPLASSEQMATQPETRPCAPDPRCGR